MKRLYLLRHAKSSWKDLTLSDFDRPLNKRGKRDAPLIAKKLKEKGIRPDIIISSPAKRARKTAKIFAKTLHVALKTEEKLYEAHTSDPNLEIGFFEFVSCSCLWGLHQI